VRDLLDCRIGHSEDHHARALDRFIQTNAVNANRIFQSLPAGLANFHMGYVKSRSLEIARQTHPHFPAGADKRYLHLATSLLLYENLQTFIMLSTGMMS
jgi:hypothetical protein